MGLSRTNGCKNWIVLGIRGIRFNLVDVANKTNQLPIDPILATLSIE